MPPLFNSIGLQLFSGEYLNAVYIQAQGPVLGQNDESPVGVHKREI